MSKIHLLVMFGLLCLFVVVQAGVLTDQAVNSASLKAAQVGYKQSEPYYHMNERTDRLEHKPSKESPKPGNAKPIKRMERLLANNWGDMEVANV